MWRSLGWIAPLSFNLENAIVTATRLQPIIEASCSWVVSTRAHNLQPAEMYLGRDAMAEDFGLEPY
jgi:hypothetical protein